MQVLGVQAESSVHVGDRPETDILGAQRVGMRAVLIGGASWDHVPATPDACVAKLAELPGAHWPGCRGDACHRQAIGWGGVAATRMGSR